MKFAKLLPHLRAQFFVQMDKWLIQKEDLMPLHHGPGQHYHLLLHGSKRARLPVQQRIDLQQAGNLLHMPFHLCLRHPVHF